MIDTSSLRQTIINQATSGLLSNLNLDDTSVDSLIAELPEPSNKRKKLLSQSIIMDKVGEIPEHWQWVRLGEISSYGDTPKKVMPSNITDDTWILELEDIENGGRLLSKKYGSDRKPKGEKTSFSKGQILYSKLRPYLKKVLIADEDGISTPELIPFDVYAGIDPVYITYCLTNSYVDRVIEKRSYGIKMPRVDAAFMVNMPIPLPPIEEQRRIVETASQALAEIDILESAQQDIADDFLILKNKIIDAGIRGELTERLPEDGTAEELYQQIQAERDVLITEKKIKKAKSLPEVAEDEIPFDIPNSWKWVHLGSITTVLGGKRIPAGRKLTTEDTGHKYIRVSEMKNGSVITDGLLYVPEDIYPKISQYIINKEDVYITVAGTIGRVGKIPPEIDGANLTENADRLVFSNLNQNWLIYCLDSTMIQKQIEMLTTQVAQPKLAIKRIQDFIIPLPPLAEQNRIAKKIEDLMVAMPE